jgi:hypothetical protein
VPLGPLVRPGVELSGFGEPWLKCCPFQAAAKAERFPESLPPSFVMVGTAAFPPVWGSLGFVEVENLVP